MVTIHLTPATGNPGLQTEWRTAAAWAVGTREGKWKRGTITAGKPGTLPCEVMVSAKSTPRMRGRKPRFCHLSLLFGMTRALLCSVTPNSETLRGMCWPPGKQSLAGPTQGIVLHELVRARGPATRLCRSADQLCAVAPNFTSKTPFCCLSVTPQVFRPHVIERRVSPNHNPPSNASATVTPKRIQM